MTLRTSVGALVAFLLLVSASSINAEPVHVRHVEGVTFGFLVLRDLDGKAIAYGDLKQVVKDSGIVIDDLQFHFKDVFLAELIAHEQRQT